MRILLCGLAALLLGCGEKKEKAAPQAPPPLPRITHFYGNEVAVPKGGSLTLCYGTENVDKLTLEPYDDGELRPSFNRCVAHSPTKNTTYTLTATGPGGMATATFSVRVGAPAAKEKTLIQSFVVLGALPIAPGGRVQLCYTTEGAQSVTVEPNVRGNLVDGRNQCFAVTPLKTTAYVLTARSLDGGVDRMQVTVTVQ